MFEFQTSLIFPVHAVPDPGPLPQGAQPLSLDAGDGDRLGGVHIPATHPAGERLLVLGFGGNAWNAQDVAEYLHDLFPEAEIIAFHYRGYRPSTGSPSAEALLADAPLVHDFAVARVKPQRTVAIGFSIGSGVAASLAKSRRLDGLILVTPFDSLKAVAQSLYPWVPIGPLFRHEFDAASALQEVDSPVALIAAERDEIVPPERTRALRERVRNLRFDRTVAGAGHNDLYARSDFQQAMREAMNRLKP